MKNLEKILKNSTFIFAVSSFTLPLISHATNNTNEISIENNNNNKPQPIIQNNPQPLIQDNLQPNPQPIQNNPQPIIQNNPQPIQIKPLPIIQNNPQPTSKCASCWNGFIKCGKNTVTYLESDDFRQKLKELGLALTVLNDNGVIPSKIPVAQIQSALSLISSTSDAFDQASKGGTLADKLQTILKSANLLSPKLEEVFPQLTDSLNKIDLSDKTNALLQIMNIFQQGDPNDPTLNLNGALTQLKSASTPVAKLDRNNHLLQGSVKSLKQDVKTVKKLLNPNDNTVMFAYDK